MQRSDADGSLIATASGVTVTFAQLTVTDTTTTLTDADVISLSVGSANLFIGAGAVLDDQGNASDVANYLIDTVNARGFSVMGASIDLVLAVGATGDGDNAGDTYLGVETTIGGATILGVEGLQVFASGTGRLIPDGHPQAAGVGGLHHTI